MNNKDKLIIETYLKLKIKAVYADLQLIQLKKSFYKACARNSFRTDNDTNRVVDLSNTHFAGKVNVREAFTRRQWKYNKKIKQLEHELDLLKKSYESVHEPTTKSKRIWAVDVYNNMKTQSIYMHKVIHKGKVYDKENLKGRKTTTVAGSAKV